MEKVLRAWNCSMQIAFLSMEWNHRLNMELDLQSLFWPLCTAVPHWQRPRNRSPQPLPPPRIWAQIRGRYWSAKIDDISL